MFARVISAAVRGIDASRIDIEVDIADAREGGVILVGLPDAAVRESKERVRTALVNSSYCFPHAQKVTVNLAPADARKEGPVYDLPIALSILAAQDFIPPEKLAHYAVAGELALDGSVRPVRGALAIALCARDAGLRGLLIPAENAPEAAVVGDLDVLPVTTLREAVDFLAGQRTIPPTRVDLRALFQAEVNRYESDYSDVRGQEHAKRALTVAAAGGHNLIMIGPPGAGKTMLARRLPTILPPLTLDEALETTRVHSVAGQIPPGRSLMTQRPFRAPHHTISDVGLSGGGSVPRPGEISMAHNGVLFLDELPEFDRSALEVLRQPLEDGTVAIVRAAHAVTFPSRFMLVAAMNPCPCGFHGDPRRDCRCTSPQVQAYLSRVSGPLLDRIDIHLEVPSLPVGDMASRREGAGSVGMRNTVENARRIQWDRFRGAGIHCNAQMEPRHLKEHAALGPAAEAVLRRGLESLGLSARAHSRILKIARTIADLEQAATIGEDHLTEAMQYRSLDRGMSGR